LYESGVMTAENCVDAALSGLDLGESATLPSVEDYKLWLNFEGARRGLPTVPSNPTINLLDENIRLSSVAAVEDRPCVKEPDLVLLFTRALSEIASVTVIDQRKILRLTEMRGVRV
jgi:hypothetical protein